MEAAELFRESLGLIDRVARMVCARRRIAAGDTEDFVSAARLALLENDYAVLRRYEGRSSLASYFAVVFDHLLSDERIRAYGRWHPSRAAERIGAAGVLVETLVRRDGRSIDEVMSLVRQVHPALTRADVESIVAQLPERIPRPRVIAVDDLAELAVVAPQRSDVNTDAREADALAARAGQIVRCTIESFGLEDRMLVRMHFGSKMSISDISRMMRQPPRPLYRRLEARLKDLRRAIEAAGLDARSLLELIGCAMTELNFGLHVETSESRQSLNPEGTARGDALS